MKTLAIWRILMVFLAATITAAAFFYWWETRHLPITSVEVTQFVMKWWWLAIIASLTAITVIGSLLILFGKNPRLMIRIPMAVACYPFPPMLIIYWLAFVERLRPNNSFKPTPLRGVGKAS